MSPRFSFSHRAYGRWCDIELTCERAPVSVHIWSRQNFCHSRLGQFAQTVTFAAILAALRNLVSGVVLRGSEEQMLRVDAGSVVAPMADTRVGANLSDPFFVSHSMSAAIAKGIVGANLPVAVHKRALPFPATRCCDGDAAAQFTLKTAKSLGSAREEFGTAMLAISRSSDPL